MAWAAPSIDESKVAALATAMRIRPLTARLLVARGIAEADLAARFLAPRLANLRPPDGMADLPRAVDRLTVARAASRHAGYGLGVDDVARFAADGCHVLVTGDCGTSDHDALAAARARGI